MNAHRTGRGHLVLEHAIDQIIIGRTYRTELGDLAELRASIETLGLLCPIVITVDRVLISGRRRLEVMRQLGHTTVPVWVAAEVSDELRTLLAIQDDNLLRKDLTTTEKAALYAEYKALLAEENARRQEATRFGATPLPDDTDHHHTNDHDRPDPRDPGGAGEAGGHGGWDSQPPSKRKSRVQAAQAVTGRDSSQQLEQVLALQRLATSDDEDEQVRQAAAEALVEINTDGKVHGRYHEVMALRGVRWLEDAAIDEALPAAVRDEAANELTALAAIERSQDRARAAAAAITRIRTLRITPRDESGAVDAPPEHADDAGEAGLQMRGVYHSRRLVDTFTRAEGWWDVNDAALVGTYATDEQWELIRAHRARAAAFLDAAEAARQAAREAHAS